VLAAAVGFGTFAISLVALRELTRADLDAVLDMLRKRRG
jgi:hypothetical protein